MNCNRELKKINISTIVIFTLFFLLLSNILDKLTIGARWSSGLLLGGVDNWLSGGSMYTVQEEGMTPGSSYNPGSLFLALLSRLIFGSGAETSIIISGAVVAILLLQGFSSLISDNKNKSIYFIIAGCFFLSEFKWARFYLLEFHPDIPAIVCFLWGVLFINRYLKRRNKLLLPCIAVLFYLSGLFKQNAAFFFIGLGLFVLFTKYLKANDKITILTIETISGLSVIVTMLMIDGCFYNCVIVNSQHPLMPPNEFLSYIISTLKTDMFFSLFVLLFFTLLLRKVYYLDFIEKVWLITSIPWFAFCMLGSAKEGANWGNIDAAIIVFLPFAVKSVLFTYVYINDVLKSKFSLRLNKRVYIASSIIVMLLCIIIISHSIISISNNYDIYRNRIEQEKAFSKWLSINFKGKNVAYNTESYEILNKADVIKKTDLYTTYVYCMGNILNDEKLHSISDKEEWDVIITTSDYGASKWPQTFSKFILLEKDKYPSIESFGETVDVYVRR